MTNVLHLNFRFMMVLILVMLDDGTMVLLETLMIHVSGAFFLEHKQMIHGLRAAQLPIPT